MAFHNVVAFSSHPRKFLQENKEQGHSSERSNVLKPAVYPCWTLIRLVPPYGSVSDAPRRKDARDCGGRDAPAADRCAAAGERWDRAFGVASLGHAGDGRGCAIPGGGAESAALWREVCRVIWGVPGGRLVCVIWDIWVVWVI